MKFNIVTAPAAAMLAIAATLAATPAIAQQQGSSTSIDRMSDKARATTGAIYRAAGTRACGTACGRAAERVGTEVFDRSKNAANRYGEKLQAVGRNARQRLNRRGR